MKVASKGFDGIGARLLSKAFAATLLLEDALVYRDRCGSPYSPSPAPASYADRRRKRKVASFVFEKDGVL